MKIISPMAAALLAVILSGGLAGCAKDPDKIEAVAAPAGAYAALSCDELATEKARVAQLLATADKSQRQARSQDTLGVILIGVPVASLGGSDVEAQIAAYKGQVAGIDAEALRKGCR